MQNADVAQLVEQRFRKPQVVGSIPIVGSIFILKTKKSSTEPIAEVAIVEKAMHRIRYYFAFSLATSCS